MHSAVKPSRSVYADRLRELSDVALMDDAAFGHRGRWRELFQRRIGEAFARDVFDGRIIFEIGCFDAAFISKIAAKFPRTAFVGIDWKCKAIYDGAKAITEAKLANVMLLRARAQEIANIFAGPELDEIWLFHPEPCDRPNELANRLITPAFLTSAHAVLKPGGAICLKTDHREYFAWTIEQLDSQEMQRRFEVTVRSGNYWQDRAVLQQTAQRHFAREVTSYEARFVRKSKPIFYCEIRRKD